MFKLAELFVEIKAHDQPVQESIKALQGKAIAMGNALSGSLSGIFTTMTGPVGIAFNLVSGLFGMMDEGNEDVAQLGEYWTSAMEPVKQVITDVVHSVTAWIKGLKETAESSEFVKSAVEQFGIYAEAAFDNVKTAVDVGVAQFYVLKAAAEDVFVTAQGWFKDFQNTLDEIFEGPGVASIESWGQTIQTWVIDKAELVGIAVRNWVDILEIVKLQVQEKMMNLGEYIQILPANLAIIGEYIANNWKELIVDAVSAVGKVFQNLGDNIGKVAYAIAEFIQNPTGGFKFEWTPLLEGFKATAAKLPELLKPNLTDMSAQIEAVANRIAAKEASRELHAKDEAEKAHATAAADPEAAGKFKSTSFSTADFAARIRASINSDDKDDVPKQALKAAQKTAKATEEIAEAVKKPKVAVLG